MKYIEFLEPPKEDLSLFNNFIFFEPSAHRISEDEILYRGEEVVDLFNKALALSRKSSDIKDKILNNRLNRIKMMIELVKDPEFIIMTKFINKVWRRYIFFSNLGELFLDIETYASFYNLKNINNKGLYIPKANTEEPSEEELSEVEEEENEENEKEENKRKEEKTPPEEKKSST
jgi:hypothetical protein